MDVEDQLARLGISGNLFKVYRAAIELGEAPVSEVATRAGLPRTTVYDAVTRLQEHGLIALDDRGSRRFVTALDPSVLLEQAQARRQMLENMMPQLRSLYNQAKGKPNIRFYEGAEGVRTVLRDSLSAESKQLRAIFSMSELVDAPGLDEIDVYRAERIALGIHMKVVRSRSRDTADIWPSSVDELRELRFAPEHMTLSMTALIYDHRVALVSSRRENYGLIIESEEFAALQRTLFDAIWSLSHPPEAEG